MLILTEKLILTILNIVQTASSIIYSPWKCQLITIRRCSRPKQPDVLLWTTTVMSHKLQGLSYTTPKKVCGSCLINKHAQEVGTFPKAYRCGRSESMLLPLCFHVPLTWFWSFTAGVVCLCDVFVYSQRLLTRFYKSTSLPLFLCRTLTLLYHCLPDPGRQPCSFRGWPKCSLPV